MPGNKTLSLYALAMGSNRALSARMTPRLLLSIALEAVAREVGPVLAVSPTLDTAPIGPSRRRYANNALLVESALCPPAMLAALQTIETRFGRRRSRRWAARTLDIDIILWSGGTFTARDLVIPHCSFTVRDFVLAPLACIAPAWRDPRSGLTVAHLRARLQKRRQKPLRKG